MKTRHLITFLTALLLVGCNGGSGDGGNKPVDLEALSNFFTGLKESNYNFTLNSKNEALRTRELRSLSEDAISFKSGRIYMQKEYTLDRYGIFYIEGQGVQDYALTEDDEVVVEFYEGPGRVNIPRVYAGDTEYFSDSYFSHLPVDELINLDISSFKNNPSGGYYSTDKDINEKFCLLTNAYYLNWDKYSALDYYIDFTKCTTYITLENGVLHAEVKMGFQDSQKASLGIDDSYDYRPEMTISKVGNTHHQSVEDYLAHPNQLEKKTSFIDDPEEFVKAFGNIELPTPNDDFGVLVSSFADYKNQHMTIFDSSATANSINSFKAQLDQEGSKWYFNEDQTETSKEQFPYDSEIYTYSYNVELEQDGEVTEFVDYLTFTFVPANLLTADDRAIRPNGYFYAELYRLTDSEAVVGYENIKETLDYIGLTVTIPMFPKYNNFRYSLRDLGGLISIEGLGENSELAFLYEITITKYENSELEEFVTTWTNSILSNPVFEKDPDAIEQYQIGIYGAFTEDGGQLGITITGNLANVGESNECYKIYLIGVYTFE